VQSEELKRGNRRRCSRFDVATLGAHATGCAMKSKKQSKSLPNKPHIDPKKEVITREKLDPFFENIKNLIVSTAKGTENAMMRKMDKVGNNISQLQTAATEHTRMIKALDTKIDGVRTELSDKIDGVRTELKDEIQGVRTELKEEIQSTRTELKEEIQGVRTELKDEMHKMEDRLSDKLVGNAARLDDHEIRLSSLESSRT